MSELVEKVYADCALNQAPEYLERFLQTNTLQAEDGQRLRLYAPLEIAGLKTELEKEVEITHGGLHTGVDMTPTVELEWKSAEGGPFPQFAGKLTIEADEDYEHCAVALRGTYDPPLGTAGKMFDLAVGQKIAHATARELLERVRDFIENAYQETEREKHPVTGT